MSIDSSSQENMLNLKFHYTRRMADILRDEAEAEHKIQMEKELIRKAAEEAHNKKYAIVEKIRKEIAAKDVAA